jgi:hypothetical protein
MLLVVDGVSAVSITYNTASLAGFTCSHKRIDVANYEDELIQDNKHRLCYRH